jgi:hypothetical protein
MTFNGNTVRRDAFGCLMTPPAQCPPDQPDCKSSNTSFEVDCPKNLLRPEEAAPISRRPAGKEAWLRVRPWVYFDAAKNECAYKPEWFCSPPGSYAQCTGTPASVSVACKRDAAGKTLDVSSFVYTDGTGACHRVPAASCTLNRRGLCEPADGEVIPCPK